MCLQLLKQSLAVSTLTPLLLGSCSFWNSSDNCPQVPTYTIFFFIFRYRARVEKVESPSKVHVFYIDYGNVSIHISIISLYKVLNDASKVIWQSLKFWSLLAEDMWPLIVASHYYGQRLDAVVTCPMLRRTTKKRLTSVLEWWGIPTVQNCLRRI